MKSFKKTLVAVALLAATGAANASIAYDVAGDNEAYMAAYDWTTGKTFNYDTGVKYNEWVAKIGTDYSLSFDLSKDENWSNFIKGAAVNKIKWVVAVANSIDAGAAVTAKKPIPNDTLWNFAVPGHLENRAIDMNAKMGLINQAVNTSSLVLDSEAPFSGQYGFAAYLWGAAWADTQEVEAGYGESIAFQLGQSNYEVIGENFIFRNDVTMLGNWTLADNSLSFKSYMKPSDPAPVPLPAAVWMFGAGLMGLLRATRRK